MKFMNQLAYATSPAAENERGGISSRPDRPQRLLSQDSGKDENETVTARRRRPSGEQGGQRERADTPERQRADDAPRASASQPSSGQQYPSSSSGGAGGGIILALLQMLLNGGTTGKVILIAGVVVIGLLFVVGPMLLGPTDGGETADPSGSNQPAAQVQFPTNTAAPVAVRATQTPAMGIAQATPTPRATTAAGSAPATTKGQKWLVMLYQDADDKTLEQDIFYDLNEAERVGSTDRVQIVAQLDRYKAGFNGDGDWSGARRYLVTKDSNLERIGSKVVADLGQVNMADPATLVSFTTWAMKTYPADKYVLILSDHGMGWPGGMSDAGTARSTRDQNIPLVRAIGNFMPLNQIEDALQQIRTQTGLDKFEVVGMDACLMSHLEVLAALAPHARYFTGSQETEPALGWAYTAFLQSLVDKPDVSGAEVGERIVATYISGDQRVVDDQARAAMMGRGTGGGLAGLFGVPVQASAQQLAQQMSQDVTLTAVDLSRLPALLDSVNALAAAMQSGDQRTVAQARTYAQSFTSIWGSSVPPSYIDLGSFVSVLKQQSPPQAVTQAADRVLADLGRAVIAEKHGSKKPGATGISVYFPNSKLYGTAEAGAQSYDAISRRFVADSLWDDFLAYHYTGQRFAATTGGGSTAQRSGTVTAPAAGGITLSPLQMSGTVAAPGRPITLTTQVSGKNIGYIYIFAGYLDKKSNSIFIADTDYLDSASTKQAEGLYYPDWGSRDSFRLQFVWEPIVYAITDGKTDVVTMLRPEQYGATPELAAYSVDGIYKFASGNESPNVRLYFSNGVLTRIYGFTGADQNAAAGAPREIIPQEGDSVTLLEQWLDQSSDGQAVTEATQKGKTLTFSRTTLTWKEMDAAAGEYVVGFIVTDLDGNQFDVYGSVTVR